MEKEKFCKFNDSKLQSVSYHNPSVVSMIPINSKTGKEVESPWAKVTSSRTSKSGFALVFDKPGEAELALGVVSVSGAGPLKPVQNGAL